MEAPVFGVGSRGSSFNYVPNIIKMDARSAVAALSVEQLAGLVRRGEHVHVSEYIPRQEYADISDALYDLELSTAAFPNAYDGTGIGVYFTESGCPQTTAIDTSHYQQGSTCYRGVQVHTTAVTAVLQAASPSAMVYGFSQVNYPNNPRSNTPVPSICGCPIFLVGTAASIVQQGIFIALGYQDSFSWKSVAAGAVAGAFSGAAQGLGGLVKVAETAGKTMTYAKVAARALQVASAASKQYIENGKITSWASLATAGLGSVQGVQADGSLGTLVGAVGSGSGWGTALSYVTPWLGVAESYVRTGEVTPGTWANAIGSTLSTALASNDIGTDTVFGDVTTGELATNLVVGGALSMVDEDAAEDYIANYVGNEIGTALGKSIASATGLTGTARAGVAKLESDTKRGLSSEGQHEEDSRTPTMSSGDGASEADAKAELGGVGKEDSNTGGAGDKSAQLEEQGIKGPAVIGSGEDSSEKIRDTHTVQSGDSLWKIAEKQLKAAGVDATNQEIREQTLLLMELNPDLDPRNLQSGQELVLPSPLLNVDVGSDTLARYQDSDKERRQFVAEEQLARLIPEAGSTPAAGQLEQSLKGASVSTSGPEDGPLSLRETSDPAALETVLNGNITNPGMNKALVVRGKDGVTRFQDAETGRFVKSPWSGEQLSKSRDSGLQDVLELEVKTELFKERVSGSIEVTPQLRAGSGDDFVRAGLVLQGQAEVKSEATLGKDGLAVGGEASAIAQLSLASGQANGQYGKASFDVASKTEGKLGAALKAKLGGPLGVQADISAAGKIEAVALQFQGSAETADVDLLFGLVQVNVKAEGEFNVGGIGIAGEAGIQTLKTKPGVRAKVGAGVTALLGGKVKGTVEVSFDPAKISSAAEQLAEFYQDVDLNPFD